MADTAQPEYWLRGPVANIPALLQPCAHALLQARHEIRQALLNFPEEKIWSAPAGVASVAFHLQHLSGVLDRLFTYARGELLSEEQLAYLSAEGKQNDQVNLALLIQYFAAQVDHALTQLKNTSEAALTDERVVGRKQIPSTVIGLLFHAAEHTMRHTGQLLVTIAVLKQ
ncbi:MAG: DinB family protein [Bacteroidota bacterium]|nr:DinB family protein [Bacteroidota bacterium]